MGLALEQIEGFFDGVDEGPVKSEQISAGATRENEASHVSSRGSPLGKFAAQVVKLHSFAARELVKSCLQCVELSGIGEDLGGLLQRLVLIDRDQRSCRPAIARDYDVITPIGNIAEYLREVDTEVAYPNGLGHAQKCTR